MEPIQRGEQILSQQLGHAEGGVSTATCVCESTSTTLLHIHLTAQRQRSQPALVGLKRMAAVPLVLHNLEF